MLEAPVPPPEPQGHLRTEPLFRQAIVSRAEPPDAGGGLSSGGEICAGAEPAFPTARPAGTYRRTLICRLDSSSREPPGGQRHREETVPPGRRAIDGQI